MRRMVLLLGLVFSLSSALLAAPVEIRTEEDLAQLLDRVCQLVAEGQTPSATLEQTPSYTLCLRLRERLQNELRERLRREGSLVVDPEVLAESMSVSLRWVEGYAAEWGLDEAAEFVVGLTELAKQYGQRLREFLAQAKAAGYSPEEIVQFVTELAQQVTEESPAKEALEKVLDSVEELLEEASAKVPEHPEEEMKEDHGKGKGDEDHGPAYEENKKQGDDENGNGSDEDHDEGGKGKGNGQGKGADDDDDNSEGHNGKGKEHNEEDHGNHGHKGGNKD